MSWFDKLPASVRHLVLLAFPAILGWVSSTFIPSLAGKGGVSAAVAAVLGYLVLYLTPLTKQYGVAKK